MKVYNKRVSLAFILCISYTMAAEKAENNDTIPGAAQTLFKELVRQRMVRPIEASSVIQMSDTNSALVQQVRNERDNLKKQYTGGVLSHDAYAKQDEAQASLLPDNVWDKTPQCSVALQAKINTLVDQIFVSYLDGENSAAIVTHALDVNAKNKGGGIAYTIGNINVCETCSNLNSSGSESIYGDYKKNSNQFVLTDFSSDKLKGLTCFNVDATFCGIRLTCGYSSSYRFYDSEANKLLFNNGSNPNRANITVVSFDLGSEEYNDGVKRLMAYHKNGIKDANQQIEKLAIDMGISKEKAQQIYNKMMNG